MKIPAHMAFLAVALLVLSGCAANEVILRHVPQEGQKYRVAIMTFKDAPGYPGTGQIARDTLSTHILNVRRYDVVDREALDLLLKEQQLTTTGITDQSQAMKIGKLLGVDGIVVGSVTEFRKRGFMRTAIVAIDARLISVQTGEVQWTTRRRVARSGFRSFLSIMYWPLLFLPSPTETQLIDKANRSMCSSLQDAIEKNTPQYGR
ncbi:MAG: hypothetical protein A2234_10920 [Elusimicrobia bacterium RIFOXYA2_FULL_58_8]|nr:MAG: hypothetical protein A2234_10920 [Elusimicrobia bacterium RIFOXYA2_FULL_58_8]